MTAPATVISGSSEHARRVPPPVPQESGSSADRWIPLLLAVLTLALRLATAAHRPTEWDSIHLIWGLDHFDVTQYMPHAPGYWLYIFCGRVVRAVSGLPSGRSLVLLDAAGSAAAVGLGYVLGRRLGGRWLGLALAGLLATSPLLWFYGSTAATYAFDALACVALLSCWAYARPGSWHGAGAVAVLALAAGFRQSSLVLLGPVVALTLVRTIRSWSRLAAAALVGIAGLAVWVVPMALQQPGGLGVVLRTNSNVWAAAARGTAWFHKASPAAARANTFAALGTILTAVGLVLPVAVIGLLCRRTLHTARSAGAADGSAGNDGAIGAGPAIGVATGAGSVTAPGAGSGAGWLDWAAKPWVVLVVAVVPSALEALFVHFGKMGYVLAFLPALLLLILLPAAHLRGVPRALASGVVVVACLVGVQRFTMAPAVLPLRLGALSRIWTPGKNGSPFASTRREIQRWDHEQAQYAPLGAAFDPRRDVLVFVDGNGGYRYRFIENLLPAYRAHFLFAGLDYEEAQHRIHRFRPDATVEIPPGGRAVLVLDAAPPPLQALLDSGVATRVQLRSGPSVYTVPAGLHLLSMDLVSAPLLPIDQRALSR